MNKVKVQSMIRLQEEAIKKNVKLGLCCMRKLGIVMEVRMEQEGGRRLDKVFWVKVKILSIYLVGKTKIWWDAL